jgi:hypothetical protein
MLMLTEGVGGFMADFVKYELDDHSEVLFESAEASLVSLRLKPEEIALEFGVKVSGEVGWFFAKASGEASINVTLTWRKPTEVPQAPVDPDIRTIR